MGNVLDLNRERAAREASQSTPKDRKASLHAEMLNLIDEYSDLGADHLIEKFTSVRNALKAFPEMIKE